MSKLTETIRKKLSGIWGKISTPAKVVTEAVVAAVTPVTVKSLVDAAEAGNADILGQMMTIGGATLLKSTESGTGSVSVPDPLYIVNNASPAAFDLLMSLPEVDTLARKIYLRNAAYHNKPQLVEILLKDPAVADKQELQSLLEKEYTIHGLAESREPLGKLLVKYGADPKAASDVLAEASARRRVDEIAQEEAVLQRLKSFTAGLNNP